MTTPAIDTLLEMGVPVTFLTKSGECRGQLTPGDFTPGPPERPVILNEDGVRRFLKAWETRMEQTYTHPVRGEKLALRQCLVEQARQVAGCIQRGQADFQGMGFR